MYVHVHTNTQEYYSAYQKEWTKMICSTMNGPGDYYTRSSKSNKDEYHIVYMWNLTKSYKLIYIQNSNRPKT